MRGCQANSFRSVFYLPQIPNNASRLGLLTPRNIASFPRRGLITIAVIYFRSWARTRSDQSVPTLNVRRFVRRRFRFLFLAHVQAVGATKSWQFAKVAQRDVIFGRREQLLIESEQRSNRESRRVRRSQKSSATAGLRLTRTRHHSFDLSRA